MWIYDQWEKVIPDQILFWQLQFFIRHVIAFNQIMDRTWELCIGYFVYIVYITSYLSY